MSKKLEMSSAHVFSLLTTFKEEKEKEKAASKAEIQGSGKP